MLVPLFEFEGAYGAQATVITKNNMINIQVYDEFGNEMKTGKLYMNCDTDGKYYLDMDLATGELGLAAKGELGMGTTVYKMGEACSFERDYFAKYSSLGDYIGVGYNNSIKRSAKIDMDTSIKTLRIWYKTNQTDYVLEANKVGLYVDEAWKNAAYTTIEIGNETLVLNETTGLTLHEYTEGVDDDKMFIGKTFGAGYGGVKCSSVKTEYVKRRIKLSELYSDKFADNGSYIYKNSEVKYATNSISNIVMAAFISGGMITMAVPDSQGYVEVYVDKNTWNVRLALLCAKNYGSSSWNSNFDTYFYKEMDFQLMAAPKEGYSFMGIKAGKYKVKVDVEDPDYAILGDQNIEVKDSDDIQNFKFVVHKHDFEDDWKYNNTSHWKECCRIKKRVANHNYSSWIVDRDATQEVAGKKHRNCTVCGYEETQEIPKLHKHEYGTDWKVNNEGHWLECICGDRQNYSVHFSEKEATMTEAKKCDMCRHIMAPAIGHTTHTEDRSRLLYDDVSHWYACVGCNNKMSEAKHTFKWIVDCDAFEGIDGQKHEECTECGYKKEAVKIVYKVEEVTDTIEEIDTTIESEKQTEFDVEIESEQETEVVADDGQSEINTTENMPTDERKESEDDTNDSGNLKNGSGADYVLLIIIGAAVIIAITIGIVVVKKRKYKND